MNTQEKSLKLAELMGWDATKITPKADWYFIGSESAYELWKATLEPYDYSIDGLAQFAAILLKFPEVMNRFVLIKDGWHRHAKGPKGGDIYIQCKPTQANILCEVLRMNGVKL